MDPASVAGIGLAVVGLAGQCFSGAMEAMSLITRAHGMKPEYRYLTIRLQLEQQRCYNWAVGCGLTAFLNGDDDAPAGNLTGLNRTSLLEVLVEVELLVTGFIRQKGKYGCLVPDDSMANVNELPSTTETAIQYLANNDHVHDHLNLMPDLKKLWRKTRVPTGIAELPKRLKWAAIDRDKYEGLIDRLKELNDALLDLIDSNLNHKIHQSTQETKLSVLQLHSKVDDLDQLIKALLPAITIANRGSSYPTAQYWPGLSQSTSTPSYLDFRTAQRDSQADDDRFIASLARFKASASSVEGISPPNTDVTQDLSLESSQQRLYDTKISRSRVRVDRNDTDRRSKSNRCGGLYYHPNLPPQPVWIEWKQYKPSDSRLRPSQSILTRVQRLAALLSDPYKPAALRVPKCLGFFDDGELPSLETDSSEEDQGDSDEGDDRPPECRFGFVFEKVADESVLSLHDLLTKAPQPSLTRRVALAQAISHSVLSLHSVNWVHKGLRSANILFSYPANTAAPVDSISTSEIDMSEPLIAGFDYSRPAAANETTEIPTIRTEYSLYRHPDAHGVEVESGQAFVKSYDIYSLGIILVEIAAWCPIDVLLGVDKHSRRLARDGVSRSVKEAQDRLLNDEVIVEKIEAGAGSKFASALRVCLTGKTAFDLAEGDDETNEAAGFTLQRSFHRLVVRQLEGIQI